ncbi:MAG: 1-acyl-sn-glycerol-3-phosphate acyltransferase [Clostridiales bacterium]|nr:1-acyl-sn-glycerol-3-phosphate acyltransferase [Clostridiales bacterium]
MLYWFLKGVAAFLSFFLFRFRATGLDNIPQKGGVIICSNHAHSYDPIFIAYVARRRLRFLAKKELFTGKLASWFFRALGAIPVDRDITDMVAYNTAIKVLQNGEALLLFSQGHRRKTIDIHDTKSGAAFFAIKAQVPIVPVGVVSSYKFFTRVRIRIGKPINLEKYKGQRLKTALLQEITENTMRQIVQLTAQK